MMKRNVMTLMAGCLLLGSQLMSCDDTPEYAKNNWKPEPPKEEEQGPEPTPYQSLDLSLEQRVTNASSQRFASSLLLECVRQQTMKNCLPENLFISPLGMSNLLTMLANGANEQALGEITEALGADLEQLNSFYTLMAQWLPTADNQVTFSTANSLWINQGFYPSQNYMNLLHDQFGAETFVRNLNTEETRNEINRWCGDKTAGMIPEFLKERLSECFMFLANALYFNGKWEHPFEAEENTFEPFHGYSPEVKEVEMMHGQRGIYYAKKSHGELISIPYGNGTYFFNLYLPKEDVSFEYALANDDCLTTTHVDNCILTMPKFKVSYENEEVGDILERMGMHALFKPSGLEKIAEGLGCQVIKQLGEIEVNESGAKAAAVSGSIWCTWAGEVDESPTPVVKVDRPFIFSITASTEDIILFAGAVYDL